MGRAKAVVRRAKTVRRAFVEGVWAYIMADRIEGTIVVYLP